jgi:hypothetical protein
VRTDFIDSKELTNIVTIHPFAVLQKQKVWITRVCRINKRGVLCVDNIKTKKGMLNLQQALNSSLRAKQTAREEEDYEQTSWYISGFGTSMLGRYMSRLKIEPDQPIDDRLLRVFSLGNQIEDWVVDLLEENPDYEIETQNRIEDKDLGVSGRLDVLLKDKKTGEQIIVELKSKNSRAFWYMDKQGQGAQHHHKLQIWGYLWLMNIEKGNIVYISKDDQAILEYPVFRNDEDLKKQFFEEAAILNWCWKNKVPPQPEDKKSWQWKYNNYKKQIPNYLKENPPITDEKIEELKKELWS